MRDALRAEWIKALTLASTYRLVLAVAVSTVGAGYRGRRGTGQQP